MKPACTARPRALTSPTLFKDPQALLDVEQGLCVDEGLRTRNDGQLTPLEPHDSIHHRQHL